MSAWLYVYDPHSGGVKIPPHLHGAICAQAGCFSRSRSWHPRIQLRLRFKNQFCYVDTVEEGDPRPLPLCRLRFFDRDRWSLALFMYSNERYVPCSFADGQMEGTVEAALEVAEPFIVER